MNELFEAEQDEMLHEDSMKVKSAKDWQTKEIEKLQFKLSVAKSEIKCLQAELSDTKAEFEKYKRDCTQNGWELINAETAKKIMDASNGKVYAIIVNYDYLVQVIPANFIPYFDINDDNKIYLHAINEGGYDDC